MIFTIRKNKNIQPHFLNERNGWSQVLRNPTSESIYESLHGNKISDEVQSYLLSVSNKTQEILNQSILEEMDRNGIITLKPFFIQFPNAWYDLKRKLHKYGEYGFVWGVKRWHINGDNEELILSTFLRLNREDDTWETIRKNIHEEIFSNQKLAEQTQREPSMLDTSHTDIIGIRSHQQVSFLQKMIMVGLETNNTLEWWYNTEKLFKELFHPILGYLHSIFGIKFPDHIRNSKNIYELAKFLQPLIWGKTSKDKGRNWKNAWMLIKAFRAWGSLWDIREKNAQTKLLVTNVPSKLKEIGAHITNVIPKTERVIKNEKEEESTIFQGDVKIKLNSGIDFSCKIEYRAKTVRSILVKMWESEDYNTVDALRDMLWIAIIWPDSTSEETKLEIIQKFTDIMPSYGYMFKNKWLLWSDSQKKLKQYFKQDTSKRPLGTSLKMKKKSDPRLNNVSLSGFTSINNITGSENDKVTMWCEIQFYNQSGYDFWKTEHYQFDPKKIISAVCRWSYFITPHQVFNIIKEEIPDIVFKTILKSNIKKEFINYIKNWSLIPYMINNNEVIFTTKDYESWLQDKFKGAQKIDNWDQRIYDFIKALHLSAPSNS